MAVLTVWQNGKKTEIPFEGSRKIAELLTEAGILYPHPCGGRGVCGKCRIEAEGALSVPDSMEYKAGGRLSCRTIALGDAAVWLREQDEMVVEGAELGVDEAGSSEAGNAADPKNSAGLSEDGKASETGLTCAVDIGTTTVVLHVFAGEKLIFSDGFRNPQSAVAADVMGRIAHEMKEREKAEEKCPTEMAEDEAGTEDETRADEVKTVYEKYESAMKTMLCDRIRACLNKAGLFEKITRYVMTGNTTMLYLLTGRDPKALAAYPFEADELFDTNTDFFGVPMYLPRCMHAFVGADITCSVLASGMCGSGNAEDRGGEGKSAEDRSAENGSAENRSTENGCVGNDVKRPEVGKEKINLLCDVGTNGEIALYKNGKLYVSSTAAGPAFEGAGIECGCQGVPGAIEKVTLQDDELEVKTIGGGAPVGVCGSGLIDAVAALLKREDLDETGYLEDEEITLAGDVYLTQKDIRNVQLAKAAVCAGILTVLETSGTSVEEVDTFYIAGGFGSHLDVQSAAAIGLFPKELVEKAKVIGNAALKGAEMILLSETAREESLRITAMAEHVDLGGSAVFNENYVECMMF